jgi:hypothetical protein
MPVKHFTPAPKGIRPTFTVNPERQLKFRLNEYGKPVYSWEKHNGEHERVLDMDPYHIIQIMRALAEQGIKYSRCWYLFDQELRRRNVAMTGRITKLNGGRPVVIFHGPNYRTCEG